MAAAQAPVERALFPSERSRYGPAAGQGEDDAKRDASLRADFAGVGREGQPVRKRRAAARRREPFVGNETEITGRSRDRGSAPERVSHNARPPLKTSVHRHHPPWSNHAPGPCASRVGPRQRGTALC